MPDPAAVTGSEEQMARAFRDALIIIDRRIGLFLPLPMASLDTLAIKSRLDEIGQDHGGA